MFDGRHLVVYGLLKEKAGIPKTVTLVASSPDGPLSVKLEVKGGDDTDQMMIHRYVKSLSLHQSLVIVHPQVCA